MNATSPAQAAWLLALLRHNDAFYPTGAYTHSHGLEGLVDLGTVRDAESLRGQLHHSLLPSLARAELPLAAHAFAALDPLAPDWPRLRACGELAHALKTAAEARAATESLGRQRIQLLERLNPHPLVSGYTSERIPHAAPLAAALEGRVYGMPLDAVLAGLVYGALAGHLAAAMKLLRLGQNAAQALLSEALAAAQPAIAQATEVPFEDIGWFNPWLDIAAARHRHASARMFVS